ncbi:MAG: hypothetical protein JNM43_05450, partial [Planctomycetaceae bacterium]|nr:hypothetical protein [Planctomycetaceae bacterium]
MTKEERGEVWEEKQSLKKELHEMRLLQQSMGPLKLAVAQKEEAQTWLDQFGALYTEAKEQLPLLQKQIVDAEGKIESLRQEQNELQTECLESRHQREWLIREEQHVTSELDERKAHLVELQRQIEGMETRHGALQVNVEETQARLEHRESELREQLEEVRQAREELHNVRESYDCITAELNVKREEITHLKSAYSMTNKLLEAAVKKWGEIAPATLADDEEKLAELWKPALNVSAFKGEESRNELECLESLENYLSGLHLQFPPRVVRAFHTSMKVAEFSPLTVLTGISGTGKSELPRRYAEALGMHFLPIAVQPRWDSPQDMFGFYNYLEN